MSCLLGAGSGLGNQARRTACKMTEDLYISGRVMDFLSVAVSIMCE